ncbi:hypothetical protein IWQ57_003728 [Coemansia nantahalensis]|uniref:Uncharacterized protein n=1 Tax=Coemansia nantahalensis TaxID=2789366 RepID=A0ACC1JV99_9FUNG|nr:hypothetical protein IWQ57_003728 [Coemansia nantahalensis]
MAGGGSGWGADPDMPPGSPREKFRRDSPERRDRFGRDIRGRSRSPGDSRMARRRSRSPGRRPSIPDEGDRYIPQYDRERERDSGGDRRYGNRGYGGRGGRMSGRDGDSYMSGGDMMGRAGGLPDPQTYDQVVPFKYYAEWLRSTDGNRRMEQDEVRERYEEYRRKALQRLYTQFFNAHKEDDWFSERFEPERRKEYIQKLAAVKSENLSRFMADMDSGKLDNVTHTASTEQAMQHEINRRDQSSSSTLGSNGDGDGSSDEMAVAHTLFIRTVPPSVPRAALEGELRKQPGFVYLVLSEPRQDKQYHRFGWVRFENGTDMEKTLDGLGGVNIDQFQFHFSRHTNNSAAGMRLTPDVASSEERIRHDLRLVREAVKSLDERTDPEVFHSLALLQKKARDLSAAAGELSAPDGGADADDRTLPVGEEEGEDGDVTMASRDRAPGSPADKDAFGDEGDARLSLEAARRELDLLLEYLRRVHYYCYYCGHTADSSEDFARRCAKLHLRRALTSSRGPQPSGSWTRTLDNRNDVIVRPLDPERLLKEGGKSLERETDAELDSQFQQQDEGRFRCSICNKLFKGDAFVRKHIRNKHPEVVPDTLVHEITFFNNFVREAPHFVQIGTGGALGALGGGMMGGGGMRDRGAGYMPQMMPGMMMPGMMPYMMPGMVPGMMPGMMPMGNPYMMGMMGGDRGQAMYGQAFNGRPAAGRAPGGGHSDPRAVRSYVDLDAPAEGEADFGF